MSGNYVQNRSWPMPVLRINRSRSNETVVSGDSIGSGTLPRNYRNTGRHSNQGRSIAVDQMISFIDVSPTADITVARKWIDCSMNLTAKNRICFGAAITQLEEGLTPHSIYSYSIEWSHYSGGAGVIAQPFFGLYEPVATDVTPGWTDQTGTSATLSLAEFPSYVLMIKTLKSDTWFNEDTSGRVYLATEGNFLTTGFYPNGRLPYVGVEISNWSSAATRTIQDYNYSIHFRRYDGPYPFHEPDGR